MEKEGTHEKGGEGVWGGSQKVWNIIKKKQGHGCVFTA